MVLVLAVAAALIIPRTSLMEHIDKRITEAFLAKTGYELQYRKVRLSLFPYPRVVFHRPLLSSPGRFNVSMESLEVLPKLFALMRGKGRIAFILCNAPEVNLQLKGTPGTEAPPEDVAKHIQAREKAVEFLVGLASKLPELKIALSRGSLTLFEGTTPRFQFKDAHGNIRLSPDSPSVNIECRSDLFESISLKSSFSTQTLKSQGKLVLTRLIPHRLTDFFFPAATCQVEEGEADLEVTFESDGPGTFRSQFKGSVPSLKLRQNHEPIILKGGKLEGSIQSGKNQLEVVLSQLQFDTPKGGLTCKYFRDSQAPLVSLNVAGSDIDAAALRKVLLALGGNNEALAKVFEIIRAGQVPRITFDIQGTQFDDLKKLDHMVIRGNMIGGTIVVPKIELEVQDAQGEVLISESVLHGNGLEGRAKKSFGREGTLVVGLKREDGPAPFHLDISLDADLVQLPPILERVVKYEPFLREMRLMENLQGRATGRLVLGESLDAVKTDLDITSFSIKSHYRRLPFPFDLQGGTFAYHGNAVQVKSASGSVGKSQLSDISVGVQWGGKVTLDVGSNGKSRVDLNEIYPWLLTYGAVKNFLKDFESMKGVLWLDSLNLKGPVLQPKDWVFEARGRPENFLMKSSFLPDSLEVKQGRVEANQERLSFYDCSARILDTTLAGAGVFQGYTQGLRGVSLTLGGEVGEAGNAYLSNLIQLPDPFRLQSPLRFTGAKFSWARGGAISFAGRMTRNNGTTVDLDVTHEPEALTIKKIALKDANSDASLSLLWSRGEFDLSFAGALKRSSLDRLLARNPHFTGTLEGNFEAQFSLEAPLESKARGKFSMEGFQYKGDLKQPIYIERAELEAAGRQIHIQSSQGTWAGSTLNFQGNVDFSAEGFIVNLDLSADALDWEQLQQLTEKRSDRKKSGGRTPVPETQSLTLQGNAKLKAGRFTFGTLTWSNVGARITRRGDETKIDFEEGSLCGIPTPGTIRFSSRDYRLQVKPNVENLDFPPTLSCLWGKDGLITGRFDLKGDLKAAAAEMNLLRDLNGDLEFKAYKGRIYRMGLLAKILSVVNITEIYRGKFPDFTQEGFAYDFIDAEGTLANGKLTLKKGLIDGPYLKMAWRGSMDLENRTLDFTVLVSPLRTVDRIIALIPLVGKALGDSLIAFPVQVSGSIEDPSVIPLSPSAIGSGLFGFVERTFKLPLIILEPFF